MDKRILQGGERFLHPMHPAHQELQRIIREERIRTLFQPVVCLRTGKVFGFEALSRGPEESPLVFPEALFACAKQCHMLWELEILCRKKAIERSKSFIHDYHLFLNVDPQVLNDAKFQDGFTAEFLRDNQLGKDRIIFEITEKTSVEDYINFRKIIDHYRCQGFSIALDDTGAGYSGLKTVVEVHPNFMKIDMGLIRNIDKDQFKRLLIKQFCEFSRITNIEVIAEGIETFDELNEVIDIGIPFGQGYLLRRPSAEIGEANIESVNFIKERNKKKSYYFFNSPVTLLARQVTRFDKPFTPDTTGLELLHYFELNPNIQGVSIVEGRRPVGLIMKATFTSFLSTQYGYALFSGRSILPMIDWKPLIVDYESSILDVSRASMARKDNQLYDYIIVAKDGEYYGLITVRSLLEHSMEMELNNARSSNPLTKLPGNEAISSSIVSLLLKKVPFSIAYIDLDNFKPYNDTYGFLRGDRVLVFLADFLAGLLYRYAYTENSFLGHIGGDDFIVLLVAKDPLEFCRQAVAEFDLAIKQFYKPEDLTNGFVTAADRQGIMKRFPLVSLSIAVLVNNDLRYTRQEEISRKMVSIKKQCKDVRGSAYVIDG